MHYLHLYVLIFWFSEISNCSYVLVYCQSPSDDSELMIRVSKSIFISDVSPFTTRSQIPVPVMFYPYLMERPVEWLGYWLKYLGFIYQQSQEIVLSSVMTTSVLGSTQLHNRWLTGTILPEVKKSRGEADLLIVARLRMSVYTCILLLGCVCRCVVRRDIFTFSIGIIFFFPSEL